jgi:hypothetical protein
MVNLQVHSSTMNMEMLGLVLFSSVEAFKVNPMNFTELARVIKTVMDTVEPREDFDWQVAVGSDFGAFVTSRSDSIAFFSINETFFYIFSTKSCDGN